VVLGSFYFIKTRTFVCKVWSTSSGTSGIMWLVWSYTLIYLLKFGYLFIFGDALSKKINVLTFFQHISSNNIK
jgi:hypothetical protein